MSTNSAPSPTWLIVTGTVRDEPLVHARFRYLHELKKSGLVKQVVYSTWKGELQRHESLLELVKQFGFILVESDEPDIICRGHYVHQMVTLQNALEACPDNSFVLRTRTDKCGVEDGFIEKDIKALLGSGMCERESNCPLGIFDFKIGIAGSHTHASTHTPVFFFWNDRFYFGAKRDLLKFLNLNVLAFSYEKLIPEQVLFAHPYRQKIPLFSHFFNAVNQNETVQRVLQAPKPSPEKLSEFTNRLIRNQTFRRTFLTERYLIHSYFFDLQAGGDFPLLTKYGGHELSSPEEMEKISSIAHQQSLKPEEIAKDLESLTGLMLDTFGIKPVRQKQFADGALPTFSFATPDSGIIFRSPEQGYCLKARNPKLLTQVGKRDSQQIRSTGVAGYLIYGPYLPLNSGAYTVRIHGRARRLGRRKAYADVAWLTGKERRGGEPLRKSWFSGLIAEFDFSLPVSVVDFEVRVWVPAGALVSVTEVEVIPK